MSRALLLTALLAAATAIGCQGTKPTDPGGETTTGVNKGKTGSAKPGTPKPTLAPKTPAPSATRSVGLVPTPTPTGTGGTATGTPTPGPDGTATPGAGGPTPSPTPTPITTFAAGYTSSLFAGGTGGVRTDGKGAAAILGRPDGPAGMVVEHAMAGVPDALYFCDPANNQIRHATLADATVSRAAGATDAQGIQKVVNAPAGVAFDLRPTAYQIYFTEPPRSGVYRQPRSTASDDPSGAVSEIAGFQTGVYGEGQGVDDGTGGKLAVLKGATGLVMAGTTLYVADTGHHTIRMIEAVRPYMVGFVAGGKGTEGAATADADRVGARFKGPTALALDGTNLYVADTGNHCIRKIDLATAAGRVTVLAGKPGTAGHDDGAAGAATFDQPVALAVDPASGAVFVGELGTPRIRRIAKDGAVTTISGLNEPGLAVGAADASRYTGICGLAADVVANKLVALYAFDRGPVLEGAGKPGPRLIKLTPP